jgi:hypothetical protein
MNDPTRYATWGARLLSALALLACLLCAPRAHGQNQGATRVHVLHLASNMAHAYDAVKLTKALEQKVIATKGVTFVNANKMLVDVLGKAKCGEAFLKSLDTDAPLTEDAERTVSEACEARLAAPVGAPFRASEGYVWGYLYEAPDKQVRATVHLWRRGQPTRKVTLPYDAGAAEHVADRIARHLFEDGRVGDVRLVADGPVQGELYANDELVGRWSPALQELTLSTGATRFEVRAAGKAIARGQAEVRASVPVVIVRLAPVVEPPPAPPAPTVVTPPASTAPPPPPSGGWMKPAGWVSLGAGALALGFGVIANARVASLDDDFSKNASFDAYRRGLARGQDVCAAADRGAVTSEANAATPGAVSDHCSSIDTWKTLRAVSYVGGGALVVGGAALLLLAPSSGSTEARAKPSTWLATPAFGPGFAGASLSRTW